MTGIWEQPQLTPADAQTMGVWLLGMIASAEHSNDGEQGMSFSLPAQDSLRALTHDGAHWAAQVAAVCAFNVAQRLADDHGHPQPSMDMMLRFVALITEGTMP